MKISIISVGKIKEKYMRDAIAEYTKRLGAYCKIQIVEVPDEKTDENASQLMCEMVKNKEGERILKHIKEDTYVVTLEIEGMMLSSEDLANKIERLGISGKSNVVFIIGGSLGLSDSVKKRSDYAVSFSKMTFPHQLMRVVLVEQIYRSYRIITGAPYHK